MSEIHLYWMPGCSSCLRVKEFLETSGLEYRAHNCAKDLERLEDLRPHDLGVPAVRVGERAVPGGDLGAVAGLLGIDYSPPAILPPAELHDRYLQILSALERFVRQMNPETVEFIVPGRQRNLGQLAGHAARVMRYFLSMYDGVHDGAEQHLRDIRADVAVDQLLSDVETTRQSFSAWWELDGSEDPMDDGDIVLPLYWGSKTVLEGLEREVWHTAQHTRQVAHWLTELGVEVDGPLTAATLDGLPLPARVHD